MSEPIKRYREVNEAEIGLGEFVVASGDSAVGLNPAKEVFDLVAMPVVTAMVACRLESVPARRDAGSAAMGQQVRTEGRRIEALVGDNPAFTAVSQQRQNGMLIVARAALQANRHRSATSVNQGGKLGVQAALRATDRLGGLSTRRVGPMLVQLDVRAIKVTEAANGSARQLEQRSTEQSLAAPSPKPTIYRLPLSKVAGQIAPRASGAHDKNDSAEDQTVIPWRPSLPLDCANLPSALFLARIRSIFLAAPSAAPVSTNDLMIAPGHRPPLFSLVPSF